MTVSTLKKMITPLKKQNKCKHCHIANLCLGATQVKVDNKILQKLKFKSKTLKPGEHLIHQGESTSTLYAVRSGILKSYVSQADGQEFVMSFQIPPELFGWENIDKKKATMSVVALDYTNVCVIPFAQLTELFQSVPEIEMQVFRMVSKSFHKTNLASIRTSALQRVANFLLVLSEHSRLLGFPYYLCRLSMTHQDIANYLRIAPETISRTFKNMQKKEVIKMCHKKIYINDFEELRKMAV